MVLRKEQKVIDFGTEIFIKNSFNKWKNQSVLIKQILKNEYKGEFKYFIGYISNVGVIPLYIRFPQMNAFVKYWNSNNKSMSLLVHDKEVLKKM